MAKTRATPRSCSYDGARTSMEADANIIQDAWTRAQRFAVVASLGGGFMLMAALEVVFGW